MEDRQEQSDTPMHAGGDGSSLDLSGERDRGLIRKAVRQWPKRWAGLTPEFKARCMSQLAIAIDEADQIAMTGPEGVAEAAKIRLSVVKTATAMELQNQKDDHAEAGIGAASVTVNNTNNTIIAIPPPTRARIDD